MGMGVGGTVTENTTNVIDYNPTHDWEYIVDQAPNKYYSIHFYVLNSFVRYMGFTIPYLYRRKLWFQRS